MILIILLILGIYDYNSPDFNFPLWGWIIGVIVSLIELAIYVGGKALGMLSDIGDLF